MSRRYLSRGDATSSTENTVPTHRPAPPIAKRLNRNALMVAAVVMGMTVLTAVVVVSPTREAKQQGSAPAATDEAPPVPSRPAFLDQPVRSPAPVGQASSAVPPAQRTILGATTPPIPSPVSSTTPTPVSYPDAYGPRMVQPSLPGTTSAPTQAAPSPREQSFRAALASSAVVGGDDSRNAAAAATQRPPIEVQEQQLLSLGDSVLRANLHPAAGGATSATSTGQASGATSDPSATRASFSSRAVKATGENVVVHLEGAGSAYALRAGTVIPGMLITSVSSELPGEIVGQVSRNVYDSRTQRQLLIPKGSRLIGSYENQVAAGQGRLLVAWTRLILPDGRSMRLPGLALADPQGNAGAKGKVDNHWRRVFGNALLLSAIGAGVQLSQPAQANVRAAPSAGQVAAGAVGQELSTVALEILRRGMDVTPTITIPAGQPFNVLLSGDLLFEGPYTPHS